MSWTEWHGRLRGPICLGWRFAFALQVGHPSWTNSLRLTWPELPNLTRMTHQRHLEVADRIVVGRGQPPVLSAARSAGRQSIGVGGFDPVPCLWAFAQPCVNLTISNLEQPDTDGIMKLRHGWNGSKHRERRIMPRLADSEKPC